MQGVGDGISVFRNKICCNDKKNTASITTDVYFTHGKCAYSDDDDDWLWLMVPFCCYNFYNSANQFKVILCNMYSFMVLAKVLQYEILFEENMVFCSFVGVQL
jgi:hypothetical protein